MLNFAKTKIGGGVPREFWFPTPVYFFDHPDPAGMNAALLSAVLARRKAAPEGMTRSNKLGWHSKADLHSDPEFTDFFRWISTRVAEVYAEESYDPGYPPECAEMWANVSPPMAHNRWHVHPGALWSGCYYVQTPPDCGKIFFTDPRPQAQVLLPFQQELQPAQWREVHYDPRPGRVVLFPAWLGHEVETNCTRKKGNAGLRVSIAFNFRQAVPP